MAGIDKTYITSIDQYYEAKEFVEKHDTPFFWYYTWIDAKHPRKGRTFGRYRLKDWFPYDLEKDLPALLEKYEEVVLWNTPMIFDWRISLYPDLPSFIRERLNQQYPDGVPSEPVFRHKVGLRANIPHKLPRKVTLYVTFNGEDLYMEEEGDRWRFWSEIVYLGMSGIPYLDCTHFSRKWLKRKLNRWVLPKGAIIDVRDYRDFTKTITKIVVK